MTDHDAIAARVRQCAEHARPCDCEVDDCIHDRAYQDAPDYDELSAAYLNLYDEVKRLRAVLESIAKNTCCEGCQEAALVARAALKGTSE